MKVLVINSARKYIGEAAHSADLVEHLTANGVEAQLVVRADSTLADKAVERNLPVATALEFGKGFRVASVTRDIQALRRLIRREQPDIVHCHRGNDHGLTIAAIAGIRPRPAVVRTRHRVHPVDNDPVNRWLFERKTDAVLAVSKQAAASFGNMLPLIEHKLTTVLSSVDTERFNMKWRSNDIRCALGVDPEEKLIGLVARFQRVKGQEVFLKAAAKVLKEFPNARFLLAGLGPPGKKKRYEELSAELGIADRVIIREWLPEVNQVIASLDVGVLASRTSEGSSRVTYEYMASGVPAVTTAVGCIPEVVQHGHTGLIVPPEDSEAMAEAIISLLKNPDTSETISRQAQTYVLEHHNRGRWITDIIKVYEEAIARSRKPGSVADAITDYARILYLAKPIRP